MTRNFPVYFFFCALLGTLFSFFAHGKQKKTPVSTPSSIAKYAPLPSLGLFIKNPYGYLQDISLLQVLIPHWSAPQAPESFQEYVQLLRNAVALHKTQDLSEVKKICKDVDLSKIYTLKENAIFHLNQTVCLAKWTQLFPDTNVLKKAITHTENVSIFDSPSMRKDFVQYLLPSYLFPSQEDGEWAGVSFRLKDCLSQLRDSPTSMMAIEKRKNADCVLYYQDTAMMAKTSSSFKKQRPDIWKDYLLFGKEYFYQKNFEEAKRVFESSFFLCLQESQCEESLFHLIFVDIFQGKYAQALESYMHYSLYSTQLAKNSKIQYWMAYILENQKDSPNAQKIYKNIMESNPFSFYAVMAKKRIVALSEVKKNTSKKQEKEKDHWAFGFVEGKERNFGKSEGKKIHFQTPFEKHSFERLSLWIDHGDKLLIDMELNILMNEWKNKTLASDERKVKLQETSKKLAKENMHLSNFALIFKAYENQWIRMEENFMHYLFPLPYKGSIFQLARENHLEPAIVMSLIRQESAFNPKAISSAGARGLMQLMPNTARTIVKRVHPESLYTPDINLKIGTKLLYKLYSKYKGNLVYLLCAYNAGENALSRWKNRGIFEGEFLEQIESIPYEETRNYVKLIFRNLYFYKFLHDAKLDPHSVEKIFDVPLKGGL